MEKRRVRIVHVITRLIVGGAQENTLLTVKYLDRRRFEVTLAAGPTVGPEGSLEAEIPPDVHFVLIPPLVRAPSPINDLRALSALYLLMRRGRYHIAHTHTTKAGILGRIAARLAGLPAVVHTHHGHAFHGYLSPVGSRMLVAAERWLALWTDRRWLALWTDRIVCLTEAERLDYLRYGVGRPEQHLVIHSGVQVERFARQVDPEICRRSLGLRPGIPVVGCVARLVPVKGVDYLVQAFMKVRSAVPDAHLVIVGDGPERSALETSVRRLGLDGAVTFTGLRPEVADLMHAFDVVAVPSLNEGMGKVAVEAMAAGRPVVASDVVGLREVVQDGRTGFLVRSGDSQHLATALVRVLQDAGLRARMGEAGRVRATAYDTSRMVEELTEHYYGLTAAHPT